MSQTVTEMLSGPVGLGVRVLAALFSLGLVVWMVTGVQFGEQQQQQRLIVRVVMGVACLAVLVPVVVDPVGAVQWWSSTLTSLGGRWAS